MSDRWKTVAFVFHERVRANCWDSLAGQLLNLHAPHIVDGLPVCRGCDRDERGSIDAVWPCRTYTIIAATLLGTKDVEGSLTTMLHLKNLRG